jgi:ribosomal protein S18 acetylase RimI-like enzyme
MIRMLGEENLEAFQALRIAAVIEEPTYFGVSVNDIKGAPLWKLRNEFGLDGSKHFVLGKFHRRKLVGVAGFRGFESENQKHRCVLWGMYVMPEFRKRGIAKLLATTGIMRIRKAREWEIIQLGVGSKNHPAIRLYKSLGFQASRIEKKAIKIGNKYFDRTWMQLDLLETK